MNITYICTHIIHLKKKFGLLTWKSLQLIVENQESYIKDLGIEFIESQRQGEHDVVLRKTVKQCALDFNDLMIIDGRFEHNYAEPGDRIVQRLKDKNVKDRLRMNLENVLTT